MGTTNRSDMGDCDVRCYDGPVHLWFELSYAQYLTVPRLALQSMPEEWQERFAKCLNELDDRLDWRPKSGRYWVKLKGGNGKYVRDPLADYRHKPLLELKPILPPPTQEEIDKVRKILEGK